MRKNKRYKIEEILEIKEKHRYGRMSIKTLKSLVKQSAAYAEARRTRALNVLNKKGMTMPNAYRQYDDEEKSHGYRSWLDTNFQITEEDLKGSKSEIAEKLRAKFRQNAFFLGTTTSTVSGWNKTIDKYMSRVLKVTNLNENEQKIFRDKLSDKKYADIIWKSYNRLDETFKDITVKGTSDQLISQIISVVGNIDSADKVFDYFSNKFNESIGAKNRQELEEADPDIDLTARVLQPIYGIKPKGGGLHIPSTKGHKGRNK